jgi:hypothetical protein
LTNGNLCATIKAQKEKELFQMEKRYWEVREKCELAFGRLMVDYNEANLKAYHEVLGVYQDICMDVLEQLIEVNADVLKNLKD